MSLLFRSKLLDRKTAYPLFHPASDQPFPLLVEPIEFSRRLPAETQLLEFKQGISEDQIASVAVAFSNADGGVIVIGVAPDGRPVASRRLVRDSNDLPTEAFSFAQGSETPPATRSRPTFAFQLH